MARKKATRLDKRREVEAAEALAEDNGSATKKKKKATKKKTTRARAKKKDVLARRELIWVIFSGTMKEEARFSYAERKAAEERLEQLRSKSKKLYFIQPVKEPITEPAAAEGDGDDEAATKKATKKATTKKKKA